MQKYIFIYLFTSSLPHKKIQLKMIIILLNHMAVYNNSLQSTSCAKEQMIRILICFDSNLFSGPCNAIIGAQRFTGCAECSFPIRNA